MEIPRLKPKPTRPFPAAYRRGGGGIGLWRLKPKLTGPAPARPLFLRLLSALCVAAMLVATLPADIAAAQSITDSPGVVTLSGTAPVSGTAVTASLSDSDTVEGTPTWQWSRSADLESFADISGATSATYTPVAGDRGFFLRATASYEDSHGAGKTASANTSRPSDVGPVRVLSNTKAGPHYNPGNDRLKVKIPFRTGPSSQGWVLTSVQMQIVHQTGALATNPRIDSQRDSNSTLSMLDAPAGFSPDEDSFTVPEGVVLKLEADTQYWLKFDALQHFIVTDVTGEDAGDYVTVQGWTLGDQFFHEDSNTVVQYFHTDIVPVIEIQGYELQSEAALAATSPEFAAEAAARSVAEGVTSGNVGAALVATDADGDSLTYSVAATDDSDGAAHLEAFNRDFAIDTDTGQISVKPTAEIDHETLASYVVVVQVTDGKDRSGVAETTPTVDDTITLTISVTDADEDGTVTISGGDAPEEGTRLTASLSDPDTVQGTPTWQWSSAETASGPFTAISGATSSSYTPAEADGGMFLRATATYTDGFGGGKRESATTSAAVVFWSDPAFPAATASRSVEEGSTSGNLGAPVAATDADGDSLTYSVTATSGGAADLTAFKRDFSLDAETGQVSVKSTAQIDHGVRSSYVVAVQVTDGEDDSGEREDTATVDDTITLTISVLLGPRVPSFAVDTVSRSVPEGATSGSVGAAVAATDADGDSLIYSVAATSGGAADLTAFKRDFSLDAETGQVSVKPTAQIDHGVRSSYVVVVQVTDGEDADGVTETPAVVDDTVTLTVTVVADSPGSVTLSGTTPVSGTAVTASLSDPDTVEGTPTWQWSRSADLESFADISGATSASYTPVAGDRGFFLRAAASYDDSHRAGKTASASTSRPSDVGPVRVLSNTKAGSHFNPANDRLKVKIPFRTGPSSQGWVLTSVQMQIVNQGNPRATSPRIDSQRDSNSTLSELVPPDGFSPNEDSFTVPEGVVLKLEAETQYWLKFDALDQFQATASTGEDAGDYVTVQGWTLGDQFFHEDSNTVVTFDHTDILPVLEFHGYGLLGDSPEFAAGAVARSVAEGATSGNLGAALVATDADGDSLAYSAAATGDSDGAAHLEAFNRDFAVGADTGQISVKSTAEIDHETLASYVVVVQVTDGKDSSGVTETTPTVDDTITLTITVTGDSPGVVTLPDTTPAPGTAVTASLSDSDTVQGTPTWQWSRSADLESFADISGATSESYTPAAGDRGYFLSATATYDDSLGGGRSASQTARRPVGSTGRETLLRNDGQSRESSFITGTQDLRIPFTTGSQPGGYVLERVAVVLGGTDADDRRATEPRIAVADGNDGGYGEVVSVLAPPSSLGSSGSHTAWFDAPEGAHIRLEPNTRYVVVFAELAQYGHTLAPGEDDSTAPGWRLGDSVYSGSDMLLTSGAEPTIPRVRFEGYGLRGAPGAPSAVVVDSSDNGSVAVSWVPGFDGFSDVTAWQVRATPVGETPFSAGWIDVADADDDDETGDERAATIDGLEAGTVYEVEVRAVNALGSGAAAGALGYARSVLVQNYNRPATNITPRNRRHIQQFRTGPSTSGYVLSSVEVVLPSDSGDDARVRILSDASDDGTVNPVALVGELTFETDLAGDTKLFTASVGVMLAAGTEYWVEIVDSSSGGAIAVDRVSGTSGQDGDAAAGWTLGQRYEQQTAGDAWTSSDKQVKLRLRGDVTPGVPAQPEATVDSTGHETAMVSWTPRVGPAATGWQVRATPRGDTADDDGWIDVSDGDGEPGEQRSATISGFAPGSTYDIEVRANNSEGDGPAASGAFISSVPVLVQNYGAPGRRNPDRNRQHRQDFDTGDSSDGYVLESVEIELPSTSGYGARVRIVSESNGAATVVETLFFEANGAGDTKLFRAPARTVLEPDTRYSVEITSSSGGQININRVQNFDSGQDSDATAGWTLGQRREFVSQSLGYTGYEGQAKVRIRGVPATTPSAVVIAGRPQAGVQLTATLTESDDNKPLSGTAWQWSRSASASGLFVSIPGADGASYTPVAGDAGMFLRATVSYADSHGTAKMVRATAADAVLAAGDSPGAVAIAGTVAVGTQLTASVTDADVTGSVSGSWQWSRSLTAFGTFEAISGATSATFTPRAIDAAWFLRATATYDDTRGDDKTASATTAVVPGDPDRPGRVTFAGTAEVGEAFTASLADRDVPVASSLVWKWESSANRDGPFAVIAGQTSGTYTPTDAVKGLYLRATVSYTDGQGAGKSASAVTRSTVRFHSAPQFVDGDAVTLTVDENAYTSALLGEVLAVDADGDTNLSYSIVAAGGADGEADLGVFLRDFYTDELPELRVAAFASPDYERYSSVVVVLRVSDREDASGDREDDPTIDDMITVTIEVADLDEPGAVVVAGDPRAGAELSASLVDGDPTTGESWQWSRSSTLSGTYSDIAGATSAGYTPRARDAGWFLRATVTYDDTHGTDKSVFATTVDVLGSRDTRGVVAFTGERRVGTEVTAALTDGDGDVEGESWQWSRSSTTWGAFADIAGATGAAYTPVAGDAGMFLRATVTYDDGHGDDKTASATTSEVLVSGDRRGTVTLLNGGGNRVGGEWEALLSDPDGPIRSSRAYQWSSSATPTGPFTVVVGADTHVFRLSPREEHRFLRVTVSYDDGHGTGKSASATTALALPTADRRGRIDVEGSIPYPFDDGPVIGEELTASVVDLDFGVTDVTWQWALGGNRDYVDIAGATESTYTPKHSDGGDALRVTASYTDSHGTGKTAVSYSVNIPVVHTVPSFDVATAAGSVAENSASGDVGTAVTATDLDGDTLAYSVSATSGSDGAAHLAAFERDFEIDAGSGQVSVRPGAQIDYETRSSYVVLVGVTDGQDSSGNAEDPAVVDDTYTLTVTVTNQDDDGVVTFSPSRPRVDVELTAALSDDDTVSGTTTWAWSRSATASGTFSAISGETSASYTSAAGDVGMFLRATATYTDSYGADKTAAATAVVLSETPTVPAFASATVSRAVADEATSGNVGAPVAALDADGDSLTYSVVATDDTDGDEHLTAFERDFSIDTSTGQISVNAAAQIDKDTRDSYVVVVQVTDGEDDSGDDEAADSVTIDDTVTLTVTVIDGHTSPAFDEGDTASREVAEGVTSGDVGAPVAATDLDGDTLTYSVAAASRPNAAAHLAAFERDFSLDDSTGQISVNSGAQIDYKTRSFYVVAVQVTDGEDGSGETDTAIDDTIILTVNVTDDRPGTVSFGSDSPEAGTELEATLSDPDGSVSGESWVWSRSATPDGTFIDISGATSDSYEPVTDDRGYFLRATVTYTDSHGAGKTAAATARRPVGASRSTLMRNTSQSRIFGAQIAGDDRRIPFTTGSAPGGYVLERVELRFGTSAAAADNPRIYESAGVSAELGDLVSALTAPDSLNTSNSWSRARFNAPAGTHIRLEPNTRYVLRFDRFGGYEHTFSGDEDSATAPGWELGDTHYGTIALEQDGENFSPMMRFDGYRLLGAPGAPSPHVSASDAGSVTVEWDAGFDGHSDFTGWQVRATAEGEDAAADGWVDVADSDSDGDTGDEREATVSGLDAGVFYEVQVRGTNVHGTGPAADALGFTVPVLVQNYGRGATNERKNLHLQQFETGSVTAGYELLSIEVDLPKAEGGNVSVRVLADATDDSTVNPAEVVATLSFETDLAGVTKLFTAPAGTKLMPDTEYYVEITTDSGGQLTVDRVSGTSGQDSDRAAGWTLGSRYERSSSANSWSAATNKQAKIRIRGTAADQPGTVTITGGDSPEVGTELTASLTDPDGGVESTTWQWSNAETADGTYANIATATSARYTPVADDANMFLRATATYTDNHGSNKTASATTTAAVQADEDQPGSVTITGGDAPQEDTELSASVSDPDGNVTGTTWVWSSSDTSGGTFTPISGETSSTYTPTEAVGGKFLRATASYNDDHGDDKTASATTTAAVVFWSDPAFSSTTAARTVAENRTSGDVGAAIAATDADGDTLTYSAAATSDSDAAAHLADFNRDFALDTSTGQISIKSGTQIDYETRSSYKVLIRVTDNEDADGVTEGTPTIDDTVTLTVTVTNAEEDGSVTITGTAAVGSTLTASLSDPDTVDGTPSWQWARSDTEDGAYTDITTGGTSSTYTPVAADVNMFLRVTASYTDGHGSGKNASATTTAAVPASEDQPGSVSFGSDNPETGTELEATLSDEDGSVSGESWVWSRSATPDGTFADIGGASDDSYEPVAADRGYFLRATVTYTDGHDAGKTAAATARRPVGVSRGRLMSNRSQTGYVNVPVPGDDRRFPFTTGSAPGGYVLERFSLRFASMYAEAANARIYESAGDFAELGDVVSELVGPDEVNTTNFFATTWFNAPEGTHIRLEPNTRYVLRFDRVGGYRSTLSDSVDSSSAPGWELTDAVFVDDRIISLFNNNRRYSPLIDLDGYRLLGAPGVASPHVSASDAESVTVEWDAGFDGYSDFTGWQVRATAEGEDAAADGWVDVADSDSDGDTGDEREATVSGLDEGVLYEVQVRGQNAHGTGPAARVAGLTRDVLVQNYGGTDTSDFERLHLQAFGTGSETAGYELAGIEVVLPSTSGANVSVRIVSDDTEDGAVNPEVVVATLSFEADLGAGTKLFTAPAGTVLEADSDYYVEITSSGGGQVTVDRVDQATGQDSDAAAGWTLGRRYQRQSDSDPWNRHNTQAKIRLRGSVADQPGTVTITGTPAAVGSTLTASLSDPDTVDGDPTWQWARSDSQDGTYTNITTDGTSSTYTPVADDAGKWLRVTASYTDDHGPNKTADATVTAAVAAATSPSFADAAVTRSVEEGATSGNVGAAVSATDADGDTLTYSVVATTDGAAHLTAFNRDFSLNTSTGQVSVKSSAEIDFETRSSYVVVVRVTDGEDDSGDEDTEIDDTLTLTVSVRNQDEDGSVGITGTLQVGNELTASVSDPDGGVTGTTWQWSSSATSGGTYTNISGATSDKYTPKNSDAAKFLRATASYTDNQGGSKSAAGTTATAVLAAADKPGTVTITDGDAPEEGTQLSAALSDPDGNVSNTTWVWSSSATSDGTFTVISGETSSTYTPSEEVGGKFLRATATYNDDHGDNKTASATTTAAVVFWSDPAFSSTTVARSVADGATSGNVGAPVSATDEDGDSLIYSVAASSGTGGAAHLTAFNRDFAISASTGQITVKSAAQIDVDTLSSYVVVVQVTDGEDSSGDDEDPATIDDTVTLTITVIADLPGSVSFGSDSPAAGTELEATLSDGNGSLSGVSWVWSRSATPDGTFEAISGATDDSYEPVAADEGYFLRARVSYTDGHGAGKTAAAVARRPVGATRETLMRNISQDFPLVTIAEVNGPRIPFTTGSAPGGYVLERVGVSFALDNRAATNPRIVESGGDGGRVGDLVSELVPPGSFGTGGGEQIEWFNAPEGTHIRLEPNTRYVLRFDRLQDISYTHERGLDSQSKPGWDLSTVYAGDTTVDLYDNKRYVPRVRFDGYGLLGAPGAPSVSSVAADGSSVTVGWDAGFDGYSDFTGWQARATAEGEDPAADGWVDATDTDSDGDTGDEREATVSGLDSGTVYRVEVRGSNVHGTGPAARARGFTGPVLVQNYGRTATDDWRSLHLQQFETGSQTAGYELWSIEVDLHANAVGGDVRVRILSDETDDSTVNPDGDDPVATLSFEADLPGRTKLFTAPAGTELESDTEYYVEITSDSGGQLTVARASGSSGQDNDRAAGWTLGERYSRTSSDNDWAGSGNQVKLRLRGGIADQPGTVSIAGGDSPQVGTALTASLTDPDGGVTGTTWQWSRSDAVDGTYDDIATATSATYRPVADDEDMFLRATASYDDDHRTGRTASATTTAVMFFTTPAFSSDTATLSVNENVTGGNVGAVSATDRDGDTLTYSVVADTSGGADDLTAFNRDFALNTSTGQISVKSSAQIDFESRPSYVVVVRVTDGEDDSGDEEDEDSVTIDDTITLTVSVTNQDEDGTVTITGTLKVGSELTASLSDPDGVVSTTTTWQWSSSATSGGTYADIDSATSDTYTPKNSDAGKFLRATASYTDTQGSGKTAEGTTASAVLAGTDKPGTVTISGGDAPEEGTELSASLSDPDGNVTGTTWVWSSSATSGGTFTAISGETSSTYTPTEEVGGKFLRATASYTDDHGTGKTASATTAAAVVFWSDPAFSSATAARSVAEGASGDVGAAVSASDADGDSLTYSVAATSGTNGATNLTAFNSHFSLNTSTGQVSVKSGAVINFETRSSYVVVVRVTDGEDDSGDADTAIDDTTTLTISVTNADEDGTVAITGTLKVGTELTASLSDPDGGETSVTWKWSSSATANGTYADIDSATSDTYTPKNSDAGMFLRATASYTDNQGSGKSAEGTTATAVLAGDDKPGTVTITGGNAPQEGTELSASLSDPDGNVSGLSWVWSSSATSGGTFTAISGETSDTYTPSEEVGGKFLRATASYTDDHGTGKTASATTGAAVVFWSDPAFSSTTAARTVTEGATSGNVGAAVSATDADGDTLTYSVAATSSTNGAAHLTAFNRDFSLNTSTGQITVKSTAEIDFETRSSYVVVVRVTDGEDDSGDEEDEDSVTIDDTITLTVTVTNQDEDGSVSITGTLQVGNELTASLSDPDGGATGTTWVWSSSTTANGTYADISGATSDKYTPKNSDAGEFLRATASYTDNQGSGKSAAGRTATAVLAGTDQPGTVTISGGDAPEEGTEMSAALSDPDGNVTGLSWVWSRSDTAGGTYTVIGGETSSTYTPSEAVGGMFLRVTASYDDDHGDGKSASATTGAAVVFWSDPSFSSATASRSVGEGATSGNVGAAVSASDADGDSLTYSVAAISGGAADLAAFNSHFDFSAATGQVSVKSAAQIDFEVRPRYVVLVRVSDREDSSGVPDTVIDDTLRLTVSVTNADEDGSVSFAGTVQVGSELTASVSDPDGNVSGTTWVWSSSPTANGTFTDISGATSESYTPKNSDANKFLRATASYTDNQGSGKSAEGTTATAVLAGTDQPGTVTISGGDVPRAGVELSASLSDPDGNVTGLSWEWSSSATAGGPFVHIAGATSDAYAPAVGDVGRFLRATAFYGDDHGGGKSAAATTAVVLLVSSPSFDEGETASRSIVEGVTSGDVGAALSASDADGDSLGYSVAATSGTDGAAGLAAFNRDFDFSTSTGQVSVKSTAQIDFETRPSYVVVVRVTDWENSFGRPDGGAAIDDTLTLTVTVTNADEDGAVGFSSGSPQVGVVLTASLTDPDAGVTGLSWQWSRAQTAAGPFAGIAEADEAAYTPVADDLGMVLRASVSYSDEFGAKSAEATAAAAVALRRVAPVRTPVGVGGGGGGGGDGGDAAVDEVVVVRVEGATRVETATEAARVALGDPSRGPARTVIIVNGWSPADIGVAVAYAARTPNSAVLYVAPGGLSAAARELMGDYRLGAVVVVGGAAAVSDGVRVEIADIVDGEGEGEVAHVEGATRVETSAEAARAVLGDPSQGRARTVIIVNGWSPADIGVAVAYAARTANSAVLYTSATGLPEASEQVIADYPIGQVVIIGGSRAVGDGVHAQISAAAPDAEIDRLAGEDRYETAALAALGDPATLAGIDTLIIANGHSPADIGLAAAHSARTPKSAVLYTATGTMPESTYEFFARYRPTTVIIIGGTSAIAPATVTTALHDD